MILNFDTKLENKELSSYETFLNKFPNWKKYRRDIVLKGLLNKGKIIEFTLALDTRFNQKLRVLLFDEEYKDKLNLNPSSTLSLLIGYIKDIIFKIDGNNIKSININLEIIDTHSGKMIKDFPTGFMMNQTIRNNNIDFYLSRYKQKKP